MKRILYILVIMSIFGCDITKQKAGVNEIDIYEYKRLHFVDITLNNKKCRLLIDTGASNSLLDIRKAEYYGFNSILVDRNKYFGLGGRKDMYIVYNYKAEPFHISFLGTDLSDVTEYFNEHNMPVAGILGIDFLEYNKSKIDLKSNKIYLNQ